MKQLKPRKSPLEQMSIRLRPDQIEQIDLIAEVDSRSKSQVVLLLIDEAIAARKKAKEQGNG